MSALSTISERMPPRQPSIKGKPRLTMDYRAARRNAARAAIRRAAKAKKAGAFPGWD